MSPEILKALIQIGIQLLGSLIPWLGSFLGGPFGWLAGIAINWATSFLYTLLERAQRFADIDKEVHTSLVAATLSADALRKAQSEGVSKETHDKALADFLARVGDLSRIKLRKN